MTSWGLRGALLGLSAAWLLAAAPAAMAADIDDRDVERARDACRDIAHNRGWRVEDTHLRERDERRGRVLIEVEGERRGERRERMCEYDVSDREAIFEDQDDDRGRRITERDIERARDRCKDIAHNRNWVVEDTHVRRQDEERGRIVLDVEGRRRGEGNRERECVYDVRTGDARFDDQ